MAETFTRLHNKTVLQPTYGGVRGDRTQCPLCNSYCHMGSWIHTQTRDLALKCHTNPDHVYHMTCHPQIKYVFKLFFYAILFRKRTIQWRAERKEKRIAALIAIRILNEVGIREKIIRMTNLW